MSIFHVFRMISLTEEKLSRRSFCLRFLRNREIREENYCIKEISTLLRNESFHNIVLISVFLYCNYIFNVASFAFSFSGKICLKMKRTIGPA